MRLVLFHACGRETVPYIAACHPQRRWVGYDDGPFSGKQFPEHIAGLGQDAGPDTQRFGFRGVGQRVFYSVHIVVFSDEQAAGTGRVYWDDALDSWVIGRVAVLPEYRKLRIGAEILSCLEDWLKQKGAKTVMISAQCQARGFYEKCGYTAFGESYLDEECPHIRMKKEL